MKLLSFLIGVVVVYVGNVFITPIRKGLAQLVSDRTYLPIVSKQAQPPTETPAARVVHVHSTSATSWQGETAFWNYVNQDTVTTMINQGLMALASAVYMSLLGKSGLRKVAELNYHKAHYAAERIQSIPGFSLAFDAPFFNEFVIRGPAPAEEILEHLLAHDVLGGLDLGKIDPRLADHILIAVTEMNSRQEIDDLVNLLMEASHA